VIEAERANYDVAWMCRLLHVPRSSFYAWRNRVETAGQARRRELAIEVARVFKAGRGAYGCRRVAAQLNRAGHDCSVGMVADLMRQLGLAALQPRAYKRTTIGGEDPVQSPDLIGRDFTAGGVPGQRLVGDMPPQAGGAPSYLRTGQGWLYLATVLDLATRMVLGWQMADHMRTGLVVDALAMARDGGHVMAGAVFHSDRGAQYTSPVLPTDWRPDQHRADRGVLGQRRRRELLLRPEERDVPPPPLRHPRPGPLRRRRLHRSVLQPPTAALQPRLPHPTRSPHRIPNRSSRCLINNREPVQNS